MWVDKFFSPAFCYKTLLLCGYTILLPILVPNKLFPFPITHIRYVRGNLSIPSEIGKRKIKTKFSVVST